MHLHEISKSLSKLEELCEQDESITEYLDGVQMQLEEKAKNIFFYMQTFDGNMEAVDKEIKRLQGLRKFHSNQHAKLKNYITYSMNLAGLDKIETDLVKFIFRKSKSIQIDNESFLDKKFIKEKITYSPDKTAIKKAIESGEEVAGAVLVENKNLQIK